MWFILIRLRTESLFILKGIHEFYTHFIEKGKIIFYKLINISICKSIERVPYLSWQTAGPFQINKTSNVISMLHKDIPFINVSEGELKRFISIIPLNEVRKKWLHDSENS